MSWERKFLYCCDRRKIFGVDKGSPGLGLGSERQTAELLCILEKRPQEWGGEVLGSSKVEKRVELRGVHGPLGLQLPDSRNV